PFNGNANATTASEVGSRKNPPPAADTATYCFPSRPIYVAGIECAGASTFTDHSSFPVRASNARNFESTLAPMKIRFPAVVIPPPVFGVPVFSPFDASASNSPRGARHAISPVFAFTATSSPQGGGAQEYRVSGCQNRPPSGVT